MIVGFVLGPYSLDLNAESDSGTYLFHGVEVMAKSGKSFHPITAVRKKHLVVDLGDRVKRLPVHSPCVLRTQWVLSDNFVEVLSFDTSMELAKNTNELDAMANTLRAERSSATLAAEARNLGNNRQAEAIEQQNEDYQNSIQDLIERGELAKQDSADRFKIESEILPGKDIQEGYMVACVTYDIEDPDTGKVIKRGGAAKVKYLGDLRKDEVHHIKFTGSVNTFKESGAEILMYLYTGDGNPIALSNSKSLKKLTPEQVKQLREASKK